MKSKGVFWGVILFTIGILFFLRNIDVIWFSWRAFLSMWPVILLILGISLLPLKGFIRIILAFIVIILTIIFVANNPRFQEKDRWPWEFRSYNDWNDRNDQDNTDEETDEWNDQQLYESYDTTINNAVLDLDAVAGEFSIEETGDYLIKFDRQGNVGKYYLEADNAGSAAVLKLTMGDRTIHKKNISNKATISLNPNPVWDLKIDAGAAKIDFDLSPFKVDRVDIDGGASSVKIKLGDKHDNTDLTIETGVSSVTIEIPESVGCEVNASSFLTSKDLEGFDKKSDGVYQTEGFSSSAKKITVKLDAAISSLVIKRY
jgi:hypothetical protein